MRNVSVLLGLALIFGGCQNQGEQFAPDDIIVEDYEATQDALTAVKVVEPTPEMLQAAREGTALPMLAAGTCHGASTCPTQFAACTNWSSYTQCAEGQCGDILCRVPNGEPCYPDYPTPNVARMPICGWDVVPGYRVTREAYRVCFDAAQNACTEFRVSTSRICDCAEY